MGAAFALIDVMMSSRIPVKTVGLGTIASAGLLIFISGTHGRRVLTPNTSILSHQFSWYNEGKAHELFATMREFELTQARMIAHTYFSAVLAFRFWVFCDPVCAGFKPYFVTTFLASHTIMVARRRDTIPSYFC